MKENQQQKNLQEFRAQIDQIDEKIVSLLQERMAVIKDVAKFKKESGEKFFIKSAREADMIKNLIKKLPDFAPEITAAIWRKIITAANICEQPIRIAIHNPNDISDFKYLIREYYFENIPLIELDSLSSVVLELEKNEAQIAVFAMPKDDESKEHWWINLSNNKIGLKVFAKIPFFKKENSAELFLAAIKEAEKSQSDNSLLTIELDQKFDRNDLISALKTSNLRGKIIKTVKSKQFAGIAFYLVELEGFYLESDLENFKKSKISPFVKVLGHFPN